MAKLEQPPDLPGHKGAWAPGMSQVIVAGETYTLKDDKGAELELEGRDDPKVIAFLEAVDDWMASRAIYQADNPICVQKWNWVLAGWDALPDRLTKSFKTRQGGVMVP